MTPNIKTNTRKDALVEIIACVLALSLFSALIGVLSAIVTHRTE